MKFCPVCGKEVEAYHEVTFKEPYIHNNPMDGIFIYGAFSSPKETLCHERNFLHFAFYDADNVLVDHRLVQLAVEIPTTKSPSEEYNEGLAEAMEDDDDLAYVDDDWDDEDDYGY